MNLAKEDKVRAEDEAAPTRILSNENIREQIKDPKVEGPSMMSDTITFLTFGIALTIVIFMIFADEDLGRVGDAIRMEFSGYDQPVDEITTKTEFFDWLKEFTGYLFQTSYYVGRNRTRAAAPEIAYANYYVSKIRVVQRRIKITDGFSDFSNYTLKRWEGSGFDPKGSKNKHEETEPYGPNNSYVYQEQDYLSGYVTWFDMFSESQEGTADRIQQMIDNNWLDDQTRGITVDFVVYNPYVDVFTYIGLDITITKTGYISSVVNIYQMKGSYYSWTGAKMFRALCELVFLVLLTIYILQQPYLIYATYRRVKSDFQDKELNEARLSSHSPQRAPQAVIADHNETKCKAFLNKLSRVWQRMKLFFAVAFEHFTSLWNLMDLFCIALSFATFVYWIVFISYQENHKVDNSRVGNSEINDDFLYLSNLFDTTRSICAYNLIFIFIRILKCMGVIVQRVSVLFGALEKAKYDIFFFLILILAVMFSFILFVYIYFGPASESFSSMRVVVTSLFQFMNWWYGSFDTLLQDNLLVGALIFFTFMISVVFILLNMFVGFLHLGYFIANEELKLVTSGRDLVTREKVVYEIEEHWTWQAWYYFVKFFSVVSRSLDRERTKIETERACYTGILRQKKLDSELFDKEYNPMKSFGQEKNKIPLTSLYTEASANILRDKKCGEIFYCTLVFLAFVAVYIATLEMQLQVTAGHTMVVSARDAISNDVKLRLYNSTTEGDVYEVNGVVDLEYMTSWIQYGLPEFIAGFKTKYSPYHYIIGTEFRVTLRQGQDLGAVGQLDKAFARINDFNKIYKESLSGERKDNITGSSSGTIYTYEPDSGYMDKGGYVMYWESQYGAVVKAAGNLVKDGIIGPDTWDFVMEFVTYDPVASFYLYNAVIMVITEPGNIIRKVYSFPLYLPEPGTSEGAGTMMLELIFILLLGYYMADYVMGFVRKWDEYTDWVDREAPFFSKLEQYQRQKKCPELLRKLKYIMNMYRLIDVAFFVFACLSVVYWMIYVSRLHNLTRVLPYDHSKVNYHTEMSKACKIQTDYMTYSSIALIIMAIRMVEYLQYAGNMRILTTTLSMAQEDLLYFMVIFVSLIMGFAGMATIGFGQYSSSFRTLGDSWVSCFIMIMGQFDMDDVLVSSPITGTIFIFVYLIVFSYILLNVFLAILGINFNIAKLEFAKTDDRIRKLNALTCCWLKNPSHFEKSSGLGKVTLPVCTSVLDELGFESQTIHASLRWWAGGMAKQLCDEIKIRLNFKNQVLYKLSKVLPRSIRNKDDKDTISAVCERKNYFHYLRVACQFFQYQNEIIKWRLGEIEQNIADKHRKYGLERQDYFRTRQVGHVIGQEIVKRSKSVIKLSKQLKEHALNSSEHVEQPAVKRQSILKTAELARLKEASVQLAEERKRVAEEAKDALEGIGGEIKEEGSNNNESEHDEESKLDSKEGLNKFIDHSEGAKNESHGDPHMIKDGKGGERIRANSEL